MKIALVGCAPSYTDAPFRDPEWTVWACSSKNMRALPRWDAWFELHVPLGPNHYVEWLRTLPIVYVREAAGLPGEALYPEADMRARFGPYFFTSSIAYMFALAITRKPEMIGLWGVEMATSGEYAGQRPGCHYFTQMARNEGIDVEVPDGCGLLAPPAENW